MVTWKWHKFLCNFALWVSGILSFFLAVSFFALTGKSFLFAVLGVVELAAGVLEILTAVKLMKMKKEGVQLLTLSYIISAVGSVAAVVTAFSFDNLTNALAAILMIVINKVYYAKRLPYMS